MPLSDYQRKEILSIIDSLMSWSIAFPFLNPIDPEKDELDDYFDVIKKPMDLSTVRSKILGNTYSSLDEFKKDVNLIWSNAIKYNGKGSFTAKMAEQLSKVFNEGMKFVTGDDEKDWNAKFQYLKAQVDDCYPNEQLMEAILEYLETGKLPHFVKLSVKKDSGTIPDEDTFIPLSEDQKVKLVKDIMSLNKGWMLMKIYKFIESREPSFIKDDVIDTDITLFKRSTLSGIQGIINDIKQRSSQISL